MMACDVSDPEQVHGMIEKILTDFGGVDILINNAGIGMRKPFAETSLSTIEEIMRINYLGAVYCTHELLPSMIARGSGHIVNISSGAGKIGTLNMAAYCASKFAMNGWSESLYHELTTARCESLAGLSGTGAHRFQPRLSRQRAAIAAGALRRQRRCQPGGDASHRAQSIRAHHAALAGADVLAPAAVARPVSLSGTAPLSSLRDGSGEPALLNNRSGNL